MATVISNNDIAQAIYLAAKENSQEKDPLFYKKIIQFLVRRKLLRKTPEILSALEKVVNKKEGKLVVKVSSGNALSEKTKKELIHILTKRYSVQNIQLVENLDKKLLGGFMVEVNDEIIDLTIKNKIIKLQEYLTKSI